MSKTQNRVYFVDGCVARNNVVGVIAYLHELKEADCEFTRFYMYDHSQQRWVQREFTHELVSVAYTKKGEDRTWQLLSKRGVLVQRSPTGTRELPIPGADTGPGGLGYVSQLRLIDGQMYVCGFRRQVYTLDRDRWVPMHRGILAGPRDRQWGFLSIDGVRGDDIYVVGRKGEIYRYDGEGWKAIKSPTNCDLNRVRCAGDGVVYACGDSGVFLRGTGDSWEALSVPDVREHLWGLEIYGGVVYVASLKRLLQFDGESLVPVDTGLSPDIGGYRLHAADGVLWSFGQDDLAFYDGKKWERVTCPDNAG